MNNTTSSVIRSVSKIIIDSYVKSENSTLVPIPNNSYGIKIINKIAAQLLKGGSTPDPSIEIYYDSIHMQLWNHIIKYESAYLIFSIEAIRGNSGSRWIEYKKERITTYYDERERNY